MFLRPPSHLSQGLDDWAPLIWRSASATTQYLARENSRLASVLAARDVSPWETSAPQRQKFHSDDVKSVQNLVRSSDWSTWQLYCFRCCFRTADKRQTTTNVKRNRDKFTTKESIFVEYTLVYWRKHLRFACSQKNTKLYHNRPG